MRSRIAFLILAISCFTTVEAKTRCVSCERNSAGRITRSTKAKRAFEKAKPCPATGRATGACPGYVIDHVKPLACGGVDTPSNMQWQSTSQARAKDKVERRACGG